MSKKKAVVSLGHEALGSTTLEQLDAVIKTAIGRFSRGRLPAHHYPQQRPAGQHDSQINDRAAPCLH